MMKRRILSYSLFFCIFALSMLMFASAGNAATQPATFTTHNYPILGNTHVAADLNGDGRLDLVGSGSNSAAVMLNNGDGTFQAKVAYPVAGQTQDVAAGDFNGDGKMDLAVTINTPQISLSLLLGNGDGTFNAAVNFPNTSGFDSPSVAATDLNNDGKLDVVMMHSIACFTAPCTAAETITVMLGNGDGTFQPARELAAAQHMHRMTVGDFNRDGIKDLAIGSENTKLHILLGLGDGTFAPQPPMTLIPGGDLFSASNDVDVADFNGDTIQDLVVALGNGRGNVVLLGNGDGTFQQSFQITENAVSSPLNLAVADFNLDGFQDIARAMGNGSAGLMEIANGNGDGTFQAPVSYLVPPNQSSLGGIFITASDFNGDGKPDVALLVGGAGPSLKVLINTSGPPPTPPNTSTPAATSTAGPTATATATANTGFRSPVANSANGGGDGNGFESNPAGAHADDTASAVDNNSGSGTSTSCASNSKDKHSFFNYSFSVPTGATINGIEVRLDARADSTSNSPRMCVQLSWNGGNTWTAAKQTGTLGTSMATFTLGGAADTWGRAWSPADFADANFRVRVIDVSGSTSRDFFLDWVAARVTYTGGATPTSAPPTNTPGASTPTATSTPPGPTPTATAAPSTLTATPTQSPPADTVAIQRAEYIVSAKTLRVEATGTNPNATLQVYVTATNALIGVLTHKGDGRYEGELSWPTNPQNIKVVSNFGGVAFKAVTLK
jgi:hypothetical protein